MLSLKERSLFELAKSKNNFAEVVQLCNSDGQIKDVCDTSKTFWLKIMPLIGMEDIALMFAPLKEKYWRELVRALIDGIFYKKYFAFTDEYFEPPPEENPVMNVYGPIDSQLKLFEQRVSCTIPALNLFAGTRGWIIEYSFDQSVESTKFHFLLSSKDEEADRARIVDFLAFHYYRSFQKLSDFTHNSYVLINDETNIKGAQTKKDGWQDAWSFKTPFVDGRQVGWNFNSNNRPTKQFLRDLIFEQLEESNHSNWLSAQLSILFNNTFQNDDVPVGVYYRRDQPSMHAYRAVIN